MYSRALCVAMLCALVLLACGLASAQTYEAGKGLSLGVAVFHLTDSAANDILGNAYGLVAEKELGVQQNQQHSISVGWIRHAATWGNLDITQDFIPVMLNTTFRGPSKLYAGAGAGLGYTRLNTAVAQLSGSKSETKFCYQLFAGMKFGTNDKLFLEGRYINGSQNGNTGLMFSLGTTF